MAIAKIIYKENASATPEVWMDTTQKTVTSGSMLSGTTALKNDGTGITGSIASKTSSNLTASGATVTAPAGYYASDASKSVSTATQATPSISVNSTTGVITASATQTAGYVSAGTKSATENLSTQAGTTISPTESEQTAVAAGKYTLGAVKVGAISSTYVGSGVTQNDSDDLTASGATVTAPAGYYAENATKTIASGTEGTPTATKGTVSNHSISVTPSVTNSAGYISGGTHSGTEATVSASELVSGTKSITASGTTDVTNYASASVAAGSATTPATTVTANPSISVNSSGLITATASATKSVTPTVSAGYVSSGTAGTITVSGSNTEQLSTQAAQTIHPSTTDQTIASGKYLTGAQTVKAVTHNLDASKILSGTTFKIGDSSDDDCVASVTGTASSGGYSETLMKNYISRSNSFTDITWPEGLTSIGYGAFANCTRFNPSSLPSGITSIGQYAFYYCLKLALTSLPSGITSIGQYAFYYCYELALTSLPSGITSIQSYAFYNCYKLALTSLPSGVTAINAYAFYCCYKLTLTSLPSSVTYIDSLAFKNCNGITTISCNGAITTLSSNAFNGDSSHPMQLASVSFPNMTVSSLSYAFGSTTAANACQLLEFADIGSTQYIAANAFANCYALQTLVLRRTSAICSLANVSAFLNTPLRGYNSLTAEVYCPNDLISTYQTATNWSTLYNDGTVTFKKIEGSDYEID